MIDTTELGRKMMEYAGQLDDDVEFNQWCRLAPKLLSLGAVNHPQNLKELNPIERALVNRAIAVLIDKGELVIKR
jgi:hypothetical protein